MHVNWKIRNTRNSFQCSRVCKTTAQWGNGIPLAMQIEAKPTQQTANTYHSWPITLHQPGVSLVMLLCCKHACLSTPRGLFLDTNSYLMLLGRPRFSSTTSGDEDRISFTTQHGNEGGRRQRHEHKYGRYHDDGRQRLEPGRRRRRQLEQRRRTAGTGQFG